MSCKHGYNHFPTPDCPHCADLARVQAELERTRQTALNRADAMEKFGTQIHSLTAERDALTARVEELERHGLDQQRKIRYEDARIHTLTEALRQMRDLAVQHGWDCTPEDDEYPHLLLAVIAARAGVDPK